MDALIPNFCELAGKSLAEVIDSLYTKRAEKETTDLIERWGDQSPSSAYLLPFVGRSFWASFGPARRRPSIIRSDDPLKITKQIPREMYEWLSEERLEWFEKATEPFLNALRTSKLSITGIAESAENTSWDRQLIPLGFFEVGRWELQHENSRLLALDAAGTPTGVSYIACQLAGPTTKSNTGDTDVVLKTPPQADKVDHYSLKTGLAGRPSMHNWMMQALERRHQQGLTTSMLKTEAAEILSDLKRDYPDAPSHSKEGTIANHIRHRYNQLKPTK